MAEKKTPAPKAPAAKPEEAKAPAKLAETIATQALAAATTEPGAKPAAADDFSSGFVAKKRGKPVKQNVTEPDELAIDFEEDGKIVRKGLKKEVLSKGAWVTVVYLFQDLNRKKEIWGPPKVSITRYKKSNKIYMFQKEFTLSSSVQAKQFVEVVQKWLADGSLPLSTEGTEEEG